MTETCDWCGEPAEEIALELSNRDDRWLGVDVDALIDEDELKVCEDCAHRLAGKMKSVNHILGLEPEGPNESSVNRMIILTDIINSEPSIGRDWEDTIPMKSSKLSEFKFVFDDSVPQEEYEEVIRSHGATIAETVTSNTDYLVVGVDNEQAELDAAREHDVPAINDVELTDLLVDQGVEWPPADISRT